MSMHPMIASLMGAMDASHAVSAPAVPRPVPVGAATPHQRQYARILMRELDLDTRAFTLAHDRFYRMAKLAPPAHGSDVDAGLCGLDRRQISALLQALKAEVCDGE